MSGSTTVENVRQIGPVFFKTKPIFRRDKIQVSSVLTKDYEENSRAVSESKQSQTKPIGGLWPAAKWVIALKVTLENKAEF